MKTNGSLRVLKYPELVGGLILIFLKYLESMVLWFWFFQNTPQKKRWVFEKSKNNTTLSSFLWSFLRWWIGDSGFLCLGLLEMKCYCTIKEAKYSKTAENMFLYIGYPSITIYEGRVVCFVLFCLYRWNLPNRDASHSVLGLFGKLSRRRGASAWFHGVWTSCAEVLEYWMISWLKIKLNGSWKFRRNWNVPLVLLERSWWAGFDSMEFIW